MSSGHGSSHDEGELSDESHRKESEIREKLLNRLSRRKHSESEDDEDVRFTIQPKNAQKAKEMARMREKEHDKKKRQEKEEREKRDSKQRERDIKDRLERADRQTSRHDDRRKRRDNEEVKDRRGSHRDRSHEKEDKYKKHGDKKDDRKHRKKGISSSDEDSKKSKSHNRHNEDRLFDRVLDPKSIKKVDEDVLVVEDVEMSPIEILEEPEEKPITSFTLDSPAGPKKYSKFESDPETDTEEGAENNDQGSSQHSNGTGEIYSDVELMDEDESKITRSIEEEEENVEKIDENIKWQDLTEEQRELLTADVRKKLEDAYQKELISKLPVFYPGIMGCRNIAEYECVNRVDEGTFGVVYRGKDKRTDEIVALKRLKMEKEKEGFPITALREINMLLKAGNHPNIVNVKEILIGTNMDKIYMAMEFVEHDLKSLIDTMNKRNKRFSVGEQKTLLHQLLSGIEHMHKLWILHRDLKTSNLLMSHRGVLKIADFGLAREYGDPLKKFTSIVVTLWYRSPELLLGTKLYSTPVDMWSVGCILAEFILLKPLFPGKGELEELKLIFKELGTPTEKIWPGVGELEGWKQLTFENYPYNQLRKRFLSGRLLNDTGFKLLMRLLTYDPKNRISATEALQHEWFEEDPLPVPPEDFPTFPAKSEQHKAPPPATKKAEPSRMDVVDPETAKLLKQFAVKPEHMNSGGFSLKFDPSRF